ncbi:monocarboxylate transporter 13 [Tribolium castaneum]|uniref:Monocarboxylate transporter 9-like Protein n=1 Tax=Tribolium castaneum TaxID=7070 RepID=D2A1Q5_TRICA|nr:PREDICTED: monocarboxylate transporter 13 [Tribolium castaneum]XP_015834492.1 PREDICTED: monocarboxylate transporter 13 [Tribolium castaneum]EFA01509.1 Monocarboxylate transporter 9-like Protein [Tribolium castaneum]|eukprot:XP_015834491.1 PREDICTED: monocarboxylate transporter 13 [Tribolium castaneum]
MENKKTEGFTPPDGGYGWIIVLSTTLLNISVLPLVQCFGIIFEKEFKALGVTAAETSFMLHLHSAIYCSLGLIGSPLLKKYDFRRVALFGTCLMSVGILMSSFARSYGILICTFSILVGIGQGIMLPATYIATNTYFKKRLTLAVSFSVTGAGISNIFMPQVCYKLAKHLESAQSTVQILAAISLVGIVCCFFLKPIKKTEIKSDAEKCDNKSPKEELELLSPEEKVYKETTRPVANETGIFRKIYQLFNLELLKERAYVVTIIGMSISFATELNIIVMMSFILPELAGFDLQNVALAMSIQAIADIIGRLLIPLVGHYSSISPKIMYTSSLTISTVGRTVMANFHSSRSAIFFCATLIGLAKGIKAVYQSVIIPKLVPLEKLPAANGLNMLLTGVTTLALGPIIGAIHDSTKTYVYTLHAASVLSMSCVVLWIVDYFIYGRKENVTS